MFYRITFLTALFLLLLSPSHASSEKIVHSSGTGVILQEDVVTARNRALNKAFNGALREALASLYHFSDLADFNQAVGLLLSEDPHYYIERYRLLSDTRNDNLYKVELEAWVSEEKIRKRLAEIGMIRYSKEVLQLGILISTKIDDQGSRDFFEGQEQNFTAFAGQQYRTRGFDVIAGSISVDNSPRSFEKLRVNNQLTAIQGRRLGTDAVVLGQVEIRSEASRLGMNIPGDYHVAIWVRAVRSKDGSLLGIRETSFTLKQNISRFMLRQLIQQNLDSLLAVLGKDIRENIL